MVNSKVVHNPTEGLLDHSDCFLDVNKSMDGFIAPDLAG